MLKLIKVGDDIPKCQTYRKRHFKMFDVLFIHYRVFRAYITVYLYLLL